MRILIIIAEHRSLQEIFIHDASCLIFNTQKIQILPSMSVPMILVKTFFVKERIKF